MNDSLSIDMLELTKTHQNKLNSRIETFNEILKLCHKKIKESAKIDKSMCMFHVPSIRLGRPLYKLKTCIAYILLKLSQNGFQVLFEKPNCIYISWEHYRQNMVFKQTDFRPQQQHLPRFVSPNSNMMLTDESKYNKQDLLMLENNNCNNINNINDDSNYLENNISTNPFIKPNKIFDNSQPEINTTAHITKFYQNLNEKYLL
jgi:hypothetical protein